MVLEFSIKVLVSGMDLVVEQKTLLGEEVGKGKSNHSICK